MKERFEKDPFAKLLSIKFDTVESGHAVCSVEITEEMLNFNNVPHGGLIFSLADVALSAASNSDYLPSYAIEVNGSFLKKASVGETLIAKAERVNTTKRTGLYRIDVFRDEDLVATFNGTVFRSIRKTIDP